jgi:nucleoside-diphosphate-sugar epimerase
MNIFIAGGSGAIGRVLVPMLVGEGHKVVALTRSPLRAELLERMGAAPVVGDVYDEAMLTRVIADGGTELVMHQLTAFGTTDGDPYAETIRVRTDGTRSLVAAARAAGARRIIAQSISFMCSPVGSGLTDEDTPLHLDSPPGVRALAGAIESLERQTLDAYGTSATVLRYGWFFGPGTSYDPNDMIPNGLRAGTIPIAGSGAGMYSFIDLRDAAAATLKAVTSESSGVYNIVDDSPVRLRDFLPLIANMLGAPEPRPMEESVARQKFGDLRVYYWNEQRAASNAKAKREFDWQPMFPVWRRGFEDLYLTSRPGSAH